MSRRMYAALPAIVLLATLALCARPPAARADDAFELVRERIRRAIHDTNLPSLSVAVAHNGAIVWEEGFGLADRENRLPATEHTLYSLASISKPITATGLMLLVERGLVDLDKPIDDYLGEAKLHARVGSAADATVRLVANHTSGLPLHYQFFYHSEAFRPPCATRRFAGTRTWSPFPANTINTAISATASSTTSSSA